MAASEARPIPAWLSLGFRPFFFGAGLWAAAAMLLWMAMLAGALTPPSAFDPVSWHAHEFLFGYLGAAVAGFLLTATPSWTKQPALRGAPLAALFALWALGRVAVLVSAHLPPLATAALDLAAPVALAALVARQIGASGSWKHLSVLGALLVLIVGNATFHWEAAAGLYPAGGHGLRIGLAGALLLVSVVGGRVAPAFTRNWLKAQGLPGAPAAPGALDLAATGLLAAALALWVWRPEAESTAVALLAAAALHAARLSRWAGGRTLVEPLVWVLHAAYAFLPLGAVAVALAILRPEWLDPATALHVWTGGAIGLTTLAIMTRATLGHSGRALEAGPGTAALYGLLIAAVAVRVGAGLWPSADLLTLSGLLWAAAFGGFGALYGRFQLSPRAT